MIEKSFTDEEIAAIVRKHGLPRYVEPKPDLAVLLDRLGLTLPAQPPPKISSEAADAAKSTV